MEVLALYVALVFTVAFGLIAWCVIDALFDRFDGSAAAHEKRVEQMHRNLIREIDRTYRNAI